MSTTIKPTGAPPPTREGKARRLAPVPNDQASTTPTAPEQEPAGLSAEDFKKLNLPDLPIVKLDPPKCRASGLNESLYNVEGYISDPSSDPSTALIESIEREGSNREPGLVIELPEPDEKGCTHEIVTGHRRCGACRQVGVVFSARVLPADTPKDVTVAIAIDSNSTQRDRSDVQRLREALVLERYLRSILNKRKLRGTRLLQGERPLEFHDYLAAEFIPGRSGEWVRKLHEVMKAAEATPDCLLLRDITDEAARAKQVQEARKLLGSIHRQHTTVGNAYGRLNHVARPRVVSSGEAGAKAEKADEKADVAVLKVTTTIHGLVGELSAHIEDGKATTAFKRSLTPRDRNLLGKDVPKLIELLTALGVQPYPLSKGRRAKAMANANASLPKRTDLPKP